MYCIYLYLSIVISSSKGCQHRGRVSDISKKDSAAFCLSSFSTSSSVALLSLRISVISAAKRIGLNICRTHRFSTPKIDMIGVSSRFAPKSADMEKCSHITKIFDDWEFLGRMDKNNHLKPPARKRKTTYSQHIPNRFQSNYICQTQSKSIPSAPPEIIGLGEGILQEVLRSRYLVLPSWSMVFAWFSYVQLISINCLSCKWHANTIHVYHHYHAILFIKNMT